jgi:UDP-N-acetylmuramoyl-tripeptide--D-alanyl-D-alanine ligase
MEPRSLGYVMAACEGELRGGLPDQMAGSLSTDSRQAGPGSLFFALSGERFDAHDFVEQAAGQGACAVVMNRNKARKLPCAVIAVDDTRKALGRLAARYRADYQASVVAVGGSNGKTSTKEILATLLRQTFPTLWSEASFNNDVGVPLTLMKLRQEHRAVVLEVGTNHHGELQPLLAMSRPRMTVLTNIGREHLEFFKDLAGVAQEEGWLAEMTPPDGKFFVNGDSEWTPAIARRCRGQVFRAGLGEHNEWRAADIRMDARGSHFLVAAPSPAYSGAYHLSLIGRHQVTNALLAMGVAADLGVSPEQIRAGLAQCQPAKMRLQVWEVNGVQVLDDAYNANADSMAAALQTLSEFPCSGKRIAVLGDMAELGEASSEAHREIGRKAAELRVDYLVTAGRWADETAEAARAAGLEAARALPNIESAAKILKEIMRTGDVLLLKASRASGFERLGEALKS